MSTQIAAKRLRFRELERAFLPSKLLVNTRERVELVLRRVTILRVQVHLEEAGAIQAVSLALADNLRGVNQVFQERPCERGEGTRSRAERAMLLDGTGMMRRFAMITTSLPLNFFSSSRTKRC